MRTPRCGAWGKMNNTYTLEELAKLEYTDIENIDHDFYNQKDKVEHIISLFNKGEYLK